MVDTITLNRKTAPRINNNNNISSKITYHYDQFDDIDEDDPDDDLDF